MLPYGKHHIDQRDIDAVVDVLEKRFLTQGDKVPEFESALAAYCQCSYALAVNSGTSALHVACLAAGVSAGDIVWTSPNSFVASANSALYCGAKIDFVDIEPISRNLCPRLLEEKLHQAKLNNSLPKAIIVVHFAGLSCDMSTISKLCIEFGIVLIEDACHALGGKYLSLPVGSCRYSDMVVLSFHPVKGITTAEGGAVLTNDKKLHQEALLYAKHGITRDSELMESGSEELEPSCPWYYQQLKLGFNYRLSDLHAALGVSQLAKLDAFVAAREKLANRYREKLRHLPLRLPEDTPESSSAWHIFVIELLEHERAAVFAKMREKGIGVNVHYIPIHLQPYYRKLGFKPGDFPVAENYYNMALTLPLFPSLSFDEQDFVITSLIEVLD